MRDIRDIFCHLDELGLRYEQQDERSVALSFSGKHVSYDVFIIWLGPVLSIIATAEGRLPEACLDEAIRLANALNAQRIAWGAFWVRPDQRALGFELAMPCRAGISREDLELAFGAVPLNHFWPAFARVAWAGLDAQQALRTLDKAGHPGGVGPADADPPPDTGSAPKPDTDLGPPVTF